MDRPLLGIVSRFTQQKGTGLLVEIAPQLVAEDVYLVALGTGDPEYEEFFRLMQQEYPGRIVARIESQASRVPHAATNAHGAEQRSVAAGERLTAGQPATAFPAGRTRGGLPIGLQAIGPYLEDRTPIRFAGLVEREFGGFVRPPRYARD
jgi:hypothetical protein